MRFSLTDITPASEDSSDTLSKTEVETLKGILGDRDSFTLHQLIWFVRIQTLTIKELARQLTDQNPYVTKKEVIDEALQQSQLEINCGDRLGGTEATMEIRIED